MIQIKQNGHFFTDIKPILNKYTLKGYKYSYDNEAVKNSLMNIFLVFMGTLPGKPSFGNPINTEVFDLFTDYNVSVIKSALETKIREYEPRINLVNIDVVLAPEYNRMIVNLDFTYVLDGDIIYDTLSLPYSFNTISFLGGRIRPPQPMIDAKICTHSIPRS